MTPDDSAPQTDPTTPANDTQVAAATPPAAPVADQAVQLPPADGASPPTADTAPTDPAIMVPASPTPASEQVAVADPAFSPHKLTQEAIDALHKGEASAENVSKLVMHKLTTTGDGIALAVKTDGEHIEMVATKTVNTVTQHFTLRVLLKDALVEYHKFCAEVIAALGKL